MNGINVREMSKNEIKELEPNLAPVYYRGEMFKGSRHTTNPLAISTKIFETFINLGGKFLQKKITNVSYSEKSVTLYSLITYNKQYTSKMPPSEKKIWLELFFILCNL